MSKDAIIDYEVGTLAIKELEECAALLNREAEKMLREDMYTIQLAWDSGSAEKFKERYLAFVEEIKASEKETLLICEDLRRTTLRMKLAEEADTNAQ